MIKLIGLKRLVVLLALLALNAVLGAVFFLWLSPMELNVRQQSGTTSSEIAALTSKIQNIKLEMKTYQENLPKFRALKDQKTGLFVVQEKTALAKILEEKLWPQSGVIKFGGDVRVDPCSLPVATDMDYYLQVYTIKLDKVLSLVDTNFFNLIQDAMNVDIFPIQVRLKKFEIKRTAQVNDVSLNQLKSSMADNNPDNSFGFIEGTVEMERLSLIPAPNDADAAGMKPGNAPSSFRGR